MFVASRFAHGSLASFGPKGILKSEEWVAVERLFSQSLKIAEIVLQLIGIVIAFKVIAFPAHNLEIARVKHAFWAASFVQFMVEGHVMRVKVGVASAIDKLIALPI